MRARSLTLFFFAALAWAIPVHVQYPLTATPEALEKWRAARFGMFIHWGPVALTGKEIGWSRTQGDNETARNYDNLYRKFNPTEFDARAWVDVAKRSGMKYLMFTTKHLAGFSMFDSALTDHSIMHSPFGRDVVRELSDACHEAGIMLGFYYCQPDWYQPDWYNNKPRYVKYVHGQVRELMSNYGRVDDFWFDYINPKEDWDAANLFTMMRQLQPNIVINNRSSLPGDYDTPEQHIGDFNRTRPWETCMTLGTQWAYKPGDTQKSLKDCIDTLVKCAGGDGNLLLNTGPMPDGRMVPGDVARLLEVGNWMKDYGESIYGTRGGPIKPNGLVASTCKGNTLYIHMLQAQFLGGEVQLPALSRSVISARVLPGGQPATVTPNASGTLIAAASPYWQSLDTVVELTLNGPAFDIAPFTLSTNSLTTGKPATASNVYQGQVSTYGPAKAVDGDFATRWATDGGRTSDWLEVDLQTPTTFNSAIISEGYDRARSWRIEYLDGSTWKTAYTGTLIGSYLAVNFPAVTAQRVRLNYLQATNGPTVWEFQLFNR